MLKKENKNKLKQNIFCACLIGPFVVYHDEARMSKNMTVGMPRSAYTPLQ